MDEFNQVDSVEPTGTSSVNDAGFLAKLKRLFNADTSTDSGQAADAEHILNPFAEPQPASQPTQSRNLSAVSDAVANPQQGGAAAANNAATGTMPDAFAQYISSRDFLKGVDVEEDTFTEPSKTAAFINAVTQKAYGSALLDATKVFQKALDERFASYDNGLTEKINNISRGQLNYDKATKALPLMNDKSTAPVITSILNGFLKQGHDVDKALDLTKNYLNSFSKKVNNPVEAKAAQHGKELDDLFAGL